MKVLYITYNGMTSHIGRAQVFPYLKNLAEKGHDIYLISYEDGGADESAIEIAKSETAESEIHWLPQHYSSMTGPLAKIADSRSLQSAVKSAIRKYGAFDLIHCRSYVPADSALLAKRLTGARFLFDMRGFWPDQRAEGGRWPQHKWLYKLLFILWKKKEARFIKESDAIVTLTEAARSEINKWPSYNGAPISVVPCSVDLNQFRILPESNRKEIRSSLDIPADAYVFLYLGSLGSVYLLDDMIRSFYEIKKRLPAAIFLLVGQRAEDFLNRANEIGISFEKNTIRSVKVPREEVPALLNAADVGYCFIKPGYSSLGVSPTKLGEYLACGLPVICNSGVGDVTEIVERSSSGLVLDGDLADATITRFSEIENLLKIDRNTIRSRSMEQLDLKSAINTYHEIYQNICG
ncbi:glycosyltransferase family 4 protein [Alcanivorax sp. IL3]|uniref:glycosyltransferase family 4 protein n=1 Tax=unclassified Alcanivorax TaxID=2638842 RepID=UPI0039C30143